MTVVTVARTALRTFELEVVEARRLGPSYLRVTLGGPALHDFDDGGPLGTRDLRVKLVVPSPGHPPPDLTDLSPGWRRRWLARDPATRGAMRTYTVRKARVLQPDPEVDIDFVLHGDGVASSWAAAARPGDRVTVLGPRAQAQGYGGIEWRPPVASPGRPVRVLLIGDETAVPAVSAVLESLPAGYHGHAVLEVPQAADFLDVRTSADVEVRWLARCDRPHGERLRAAVGQLLQPHHGTPDDPGHPEPLEGDGGDLLWERAALDDTADRTATARGPAGDFYAWVAGEAAMVRGLRRWLVHDLGVDRRSVAFMGYWRKGAPGWT